MRTRFLLAALITVTLILNGCTPDAAPNHTPPQITFQVTPTTLPPEGGIITISWSVTNANTVLVTSDNSNALISNPEAHTNTGETLHLQTTTTFTLMTDSGLSEQRTVTVEQAADDNPNDNDDGEDEGTTGELTYSLSLTEGGAPATVIVDGTNLPTDFKNFAGDYVWNVSRALPDEPDRHKRHHQEHSPHLQFTITLTQPGDYRIEVSHPDDPLNRYYFVEFNVPPGARTPGLSTIHFEQGASSTEVHITHAGDWSLQLPTWLTTSDPLTGTGDTTITISIKPGTTPGEYTGELILTVTHPDNREEQFFSTAGFHFPRFGGLIDPKWFTTTNALDALTLSAANTQQHQKPRVDLNSIPRTAGTLTLILTHGLDEAAATLEGSSEANNVVTLRSINMLQVHTSNMRSTAELAMTLPGYDYVAEHQTLTPEFHNIPYEDYLLTHEHYFGTDWAYAVRGHLDRTNVTKLHQEGLTGDGITVAVIDSGFHETHPSFASRVEAVYATGEIDEYGNHGIFPREPLHPTCLSNDHGLSVTATAAASFTSNPDHTPGVAPEATLLLIDLSQYDPETDTCHHGGINFPLLADFLINDGDLRANVINMSWGTQDEEGIHRGLDYPSNVALKAMEDAGITIVASAGNEDTGPAAFPAENPNVIGVSSSGRSVPGPFRTYTTPGVNVMGIDQVYGVPSQYHANTRRITYGTVAGTSYAAPLVAGIAALLQQAEPTATPHEIRAALEQTAHSAYTNGVTDNNTGYGLVDAHAALEYLRSPGVLPYHKIKLSANGRPLSITVRPDGTFLTGWLPISESMTLRASTAGMSEVVWSGSVTLEALPNMNFAEIDPIIIPLSR